MPRLLHAVFLVAFCLCNCQRSEESHGADLPIEFDTLGVIRTLNLNREDSLFIHFPRDSSDYENQVTEEWKTASISSSLAPACFHAIMSIRRASPVSHYGSFVILYNHTRDHATVHRLRGDSVEMYLGSLSSFNPKVEIVDINFDNCDDIVLSFTENTTGRTGYNLFWTFDSVAGNFRSDSGLYRLFHDQEIFFDTFSDEISTGGRIGLDGFGGEDYRWDGRQYVLFARFEDQYSDDGRLKISTKQELIDGRWTVVQADTIETR